MNAEVRLENARALAVAAGIDESEAATLLEFDVAITVEQSDASGVALAADLQQLLSRTVRSASTNSNCSVPAVEVVINDAAPLLSCSRVHVHLGDQKVTIGDAPVAGPHGKVHPIGMVVGSCYAAGAVLRCVIGDSLLLPRCERLCVDLRELVSGDLRLLSEPNQIGEVFLVGAGAVGNGFVRGLACFNASGRLHIVDDDTVSFGNLQRCYYFRESDVGHLKAERLSHAARSITGLEVIPHVCRLDQVSQRTNGPWLKRLVVAVDSPRARRALQTELPGEVFDASTTDIREIVLHAHRQPTDGACMACIYHHSPQEHAREQHIADALGVSVDEVRMQNRISDTAARKIVVRYPQLRWENITGTAYDTLFKQLCGTAALKTTAGKQAVAPFAFVSVLAGALLALEFVIRLNDVANARFNEWRVSPWSNPVFRRRRFLRARPDCEFCGTDVLVQVVETLWPKHRPA